MQPSRTRAQAKRRIRDCTRGHRHATRYVCRIADRNKSLLSADILRAEVAKQRIWLRDYKPERYDCEDFAASLCAAIVHSCASRSDLEYGPAIGPIRYRGHSTGCALLSNNGLYLFEPQQKWGLFRVDSSVQRIESIMM